MFNSLKQVIQTKRVCQHFKWVCQWLRYTVCHSHLFKRISLTWMYPFHKPHFLCMNIIIIIVYNSIQRQRSVNKSRLWVSLTVNRKWLKYQEETLRSKYLTKWTASFPLSWEGVSDDCHGAMPPFTTHSFLHPQHLPNTRWVINQCLESFHVHLCCAIFVRAEMLN